MNFSCRSIFSAKPFIRRRVRDMFGVAVAATILCSTSSAALIVYEPFDYDNPPERVLGQTNPSTGNTWLLAAAAGAGGDTTAINTASGNLTPPPILGAAVGNSATITGVGSLSGATNRLDLPAAAHMAANSGDTMYYSLLLRIDDVSNSNTGVGGFFIGLNNGSGSQTSNPGSVAARLQVRQDPNDTSKYNLGIIRQRTAAAANIPWSGPMTPGETLFLVASTELVTGTANDISRLWINPDPSTFMAASPPPATLTDDDLSLGGTDIGVTSLLLRQSPAPFLTLDEIRVGNTWAAVTAPEPSTITLLALCMIGVMSRRCRKP